MTSKERVLKALRFETPDRCPVNIRLSKALENHFKAERGPDFHEIDLGSECYISTTRYDRSWPAGTQIVEENETRRRVYAFDEIADWRAMAFPSGIDPMFTKKIKNKADELSDCIPIFIHHLGVMHIVCDGLFGIERFCAAIYEAPDEVHAACRKAAEIGAQVVEELCALPIDGLWLADDLCSQTGPIVSPEALREFIMPYDAEILAPACAAGKVIIFHTDGKVSDVLGDLVKIGVQVVNPLQPDINDIREFKANWHGKLAVIGGIDNRNVIAHGTTEEIRMHVRETFDVLGTGGGMVLSSHELPDHTPPENALAFIDASKSCVY